MKQIKVIIADDHSILRQGVLRVLGTDPRMQILGEAATTQELKTLLRKEVPDVLILDLSMPDGGAMSVLGDLKDQYPGMSVLILSMHPEDHYALRMLKLGASGYLTKDCATDQLLNAVNVVAKGQKFITPKVAEILTSVLRKPDDERPAHTQLSEREFLVLTMLGKGHALTEIAQSCSLSVKTVSTYRTRLIRKMGLKNNAEIVQYVLKHQLSATAMVAFVGNFSQAISVF